MRESFPLKKHNDEEAMEKSKSGYIKSYIHYESDALAIAQVLSPVFY